MAKIDIHNVKITEREFMEMMYLNVNTSSYILNAMFCRLRNKTNPKYGGDSEWTGKERKIAEHINNTFEGLK